MIGSRLFNQTRLTNSIRRDFRLWANLLNSALCQFGKLVVVESEKEQGL
jgi:hypothetical protein